MKNNADENKRCQLFLNQQKQINKYYSKKKKAFKNYIDQKASEFKDKYSNFKQFSTIIMQYPENIKKNIENLEKNLSNFTSTNTPDEYLSDLESFLINQRDAEKDKYERLSPEFTKMVQDYEKKGKEKINILNRYLNEYNTSIDKLNSSHINYLKHFNDYEVKMIKDETKETKETEEENLEHFIPKEDTILLVLHSNESQYKINLENTNKELNIIYNETNKAINDLNLFIKEINNIMLSNLSNIYIGCVAGSKMQKIYENKILKLNENNYNKNSNNNISDNKDDKLKLENIFENIIFKSYDLISPFANISGYKQQNKILAKLKPEIIYKISCMINSEFNYIPKVDLKEQYTIMDVKLICQRILDQTAINKKEEEQLYSYLEERKYMIAFLAALNKLRAAGKFQIKKKSLIILGNAVRTIVDNLYRKNNIDIEIVRYLIIMTLTYFAIGKNGKDKIYLIRFIEDSPYFKSEQLWINYITEIIDKELEIQNSKSLWDLDLEDENYKMNQVYFGVFLSFTQNILEFHLDKNFVYKVIHDLTDTKYKLSKEFMEQIDALIENRTHEEIDKFDPEKDIL